MAIANPRRLTYGMVQRKLKAADRKLASLKSRLEKRGINPHYTLPWHSNVKNDRVGKKLLSQWRTTLDKRDALAQRYYDKITPSIGDIFSNPSRAKSVAKQLAKGIQCKSVRIKRVNGALRVEIKK